MNDAILSGKKAMNVVMVKIKRKTNGRNRECIVVCKRKRKEKIEYFTHRAWHNSFGSEILFFVSDISTFLNVWRWVFCMLTGCFDMHM